MDEAIINNDKDFFIEPQKIELSAGTDFFVRNLNFKSDYEEEYQLDKTMVHLFFCFSGMESSVFPELKKEFTIGQGKCGIFLGQKGLNGLSKLSGRNPFSLLSIELSPERLREITGSSHKILPEEYKRIAEGKETGCFGRSMNMTPLMKVSLSQLMNCNFGKETKRLYYEAKSIELISCMLEQLSFTSPPDQYFNVCEINKIKNVREILLADLANPPALMELAANVGMDHTKLNKGFRKVYGMTIFAYLSEKRLEKAKKYLERGDMNCTETAFALGYSSPSHFAKAFKDKYNVTPSCFIKKIVPTLQY